MGEKKEKKKEKEKEKEEEKLLYLYLKNNFFHFLFTFSRAHLRAFARAYNITFFLRARAHAREKVTRIAIIDRPLSMIVGGRVGALFFIVCFLSVYRYKSSVFVSLLPHVADWMNEKSWERTDKGGSSTGSFDLRGRVSPFFVFFSLSSCYCISSLFFIEEEVNDDFTWRKEHFLGKNSSLSFFETGFEYRWGSFVSIKIESSLLFFGMKKHVTTQRLSSIHLRCSAYHDTRLSWDRSKKLW